MTHEHGVAGIDPHKNSATIAVLDDLHFEVARALEVALHVHEVVPEEPLAFAATSGSFMRRHPAGFDGAGALRPLRLARSRPRCRL